MVDYWEFNRRFYDHRIPVYSIELWCGKVFTMTISPNICIICSGDFLPVRERWRVCRSRSQLSHVWNLLTWWNVDIMMYFNLTIIHYNIAKTCLVFYCMRLGQEFSWLYDSILFTLDYTVGTKVELNISFISFKVFQNVQPDGVWGHIFIAGLPRTGCRPSYFIRHRPLLQVNYITSRIYNCEKVHVCQKEEQRINV